jgi:hypothetical protein
MDKEQKPTETTEELRERIKGLNATVAQQHDHIKELDAKIARVDEILKEFTAKNAEIDQRHTKPPEQYTMETDMKLRERITEFDDAIARMERRESVEPWASIDGVLLANARETRETRIVIAADYYLNRMIRVWGKPREELMPFLRECARAEVLGKPYVFAGLDWDGIYLTPSEKIPIGVTENIAWLQATCKVWFPDDSGDLSDMKVARWTIVGGDHSEILLSPHVKQIIHQNNIGSVTTNTAFQCISVRLPEGFKDAMPPHIIRGRGAGARVWLEMNALPDIADRIPMFELETSGIAAELAEDAKSLEGRVDRLRVLLEQARVKA